MGGGIIEFKEDRRFLTGLRNGILHIDNTRNSCNSEEIVGKPLLKQ
jgi:hypothetical protein